MIKLTKQSVCSRLGVASFDETILSRGLTRLPKISPNGPWIAGGAVRRTLQGTILDTDWDFFFRDQKQAEEFEAELSKKSARLLTKTDKASNFVIPSVIPVGTEGKGIYLPEMKIQAIKFQFYRSPEEVIDSFDFTVAQFAFDGDHLYVADFALWDVARMKLVPHRLTYATASLRRVMKYADQGFTVCAGALTEILTQVVTNPTIIQAETKYID